VRQTIDFFFATPHEKRIQGLPAYGGAEGEQGFGVWGFA